MSVDFRKMTGWLFFFMVLAAFLTGLILVGIGVYLLFSTGGEGTINLVVENIGEATGINGHLVIFLIGVILILIPVSFVLKAFNEAIKHGLFDLIKFIKYFSP